MGGLDGPECMSHCINPCTALRRTCGRTSARRRRPRSPSPGRPSGPPGRTAGLPRAAIVAFGYPGPGIAPRQRCSGHALDVHCHGRHRSVALESQSHQRSTHGLGDALGVDHRRWETTAGQRSDSGLRGFKIARACRERSTRVSCRNNGQAVLASNSSALCLVY
jgi:hypothetical protein